MAFMDTGALCGREGRQAGQNKISQREGVPGDKARLADTIEMMEGG